MEKLTKKVTVNTTILKETFVLLKVLAARESKKSNTLLEEALHDLFKKYKARL